MRLNHRRQIAAALAHPAVMRVTPFAIFIAFVALSSLVHEIAPQHAEWDLRWLNVLRTVAVALALAYFWRGYRERGAAGAMKPHQWLLAIGTGLAVFLVWINFDDGWTRGSSARPIRGAPAPALSH